MPYFLTLFILATASLMAKDYGTFGTTFTIQEEDLLVVLKERLAKASFDETKREACQQVFRERIEHPRGKVFPQATMSRCFEYDPSLCLQEDIKDHNEKVIVTKGTRVNPLETTALTEELLIFDGNVPSQVAWARKMTGMWILTNGKPLELESKEQRPVYFDQASYLTNKLGIKTLPAKVSQNNRKLKIEEIPCL